MDFSLIPTILLDFDASVAFGGIWSIIKNVWQTVFSLLNQIKIGGVSLLFINIALSIFGLIFTIFFAVVKSGVSTSIDTASSVRDSRRAHDDDVKNGYKKYEAERHKREAYDRIYKERNKK